MVFFRIVHPSGAVYQSRSETGSTISMRSHEAGMPQGSKQWMPKTGDLNIDGVISLHIPSKTQVKGQQWHKLGGTPYK